MTTLALGAAPEAPLVDRVIAGRYRICRVIAVGGMGTVYEAHDEQADRAVALKVLHPHRSLSPVALRRFEQEVQLARELSCVHVARIHDSGCDGSLHYVAMELLVGKDLRQLLEEEAPLSVARAVELVLGACRALQRMHVRGWVHRDVKPDNLFVASGESERLVVLDLGIAKTSSQNAPSTEESAFLGTVGYVAPEQVESSKRVDERADVYALGLVLLECLTGRPVFRGERSQVLYDVVFGAEPLERSAAQLPPALAGVLRRATTRDPEQRTPSVRAFAAELLPFAGDARLVASLPDSVRDPQQLGEDQAPTTTDDGVDPAESMGVRRRKERGRLVSGGRVAMLLGAAALGLGLVKLEAKQASTGTASRPSASSGAATAEGEQDVVGAPPKGLVTAVFRQQPRVAAVPSALGEDPPAVRAGPRLLSEVPSSPAASSSSPEKPAAIREATAEPSVPRAKTGSPRRAEAEVPKKRSASEPEAVSALVEPGQIFASGDPYASE